MFPGASAEVYYNEAGEPVGWDYPSADADYCDVCGITHSGPCDDGWEDDAR